MRSIRCDACGMKALLAASQCPHCGHLFEVRDSFGELLPLAHCPTCDSDYPLTRGECRWCGTKPEAFRIAPYAWKGAGILAFLGLGVGAWLANRSTGEDRAPSQSQLVKLNDTLDPARDSLVPQREIVAMPRDTVLPQRDSIALQRVDSIVVPLTIAQGVSVDTTRQEPPSPVVTAKAIPVELPDAIAPVQPTTTVEKTPVRVSRTVAPRARSSAKPPTPQTRRVRWVGGVARAWIPVRASANSKSRVVASIGPDTRVQLGEVRGTWIRLRMRGLSGWVERRHFLSRSESAR